MKYDVDTEFEFEKDENGDPLLPKDVEWDGNLYVLPNGKYLPAGCYMTEDGGAIIYEPRELSPFADMLAQFKRARD